MVSEIMYCSKLHMRLGTHVQPPLKKFISVFRFPQVSVHNFCGNQWQTYASHENYAAQRSQGFAVLHLLLNFASRGGESDCSQTAVGELQFFLDCSHPPTSPVPYRPYNLLILNSMIVKTLFQWVQYLL